jgi:hypothetical protein
VLQPAGGAPIALPDLGCDAVFGGAAADGMWRCAEAAPYRANLAPFTATLVHARPGPPAKVTPSGSSGDEAFDACVAGWLGGVALGETPYKGAYTVRIEVAW